jgi:hypothetical protein
MKRLNSRTYRLKQRPIRSEADELRGYIGLKMRKEALQLALFFLNKPALTRNIFLDCLEAVETFAKKPKNWRPLIETAHDRLSCSDQRKVRFWMLIYFDAQIQDDKAMLRFAPKRMTHKTGLVDLLLVWDAFLRLGRMDKLQRMARLMPQAIKTALYPAMKILLKRSYDNYLAAKLAANK